MHRLAYAYLNFQSVNLYLPMNSRWLMTCYSNFASLLMSKVLIFNLWFKKIYKNYLGFEALPQGR